MCLSLCPSVERKSNTTEWLEVAQRNEVDTVDEFSVVFSGLSNRLHYQFKVTTSFKDDDKIVAGLPSPVSKAVIPRCPGVLSLL